MFVSWDILPQPERERQWEQCHRRGQENPGRPVRTPCYEHGQDDLHSGSANVVLSAAPEVQMDGLFEFWSNYPVHGDKIAYSKIALGVLDLLDRKLPDGDLRFNLSSRKRGRDSRLDRHSSGGGSSFSTSRSNRDPAGGTRNGQSDRDPSTPRHNSSYWAYPGDYSQPGDCFCRQSGPRRD